MNATFRKQLAIATALQLVDVPSKHRIGVQTGTTRRQSEAHRRRSDIVPPAQYRAKQAPVRQMGINE